MGVGALAGSGWREKSGTPMARSWRSSDQSESMEAFMDPEEAFMESLPEHNCFWRNRRNREQLAEAPAGSSSLEQKHNSFRVLDARFVAPQNRVHNRGELDGFAEKPVLLQGGQLLRGFDGTH